MSKKQTVQNKPTNPKYTRATAEAALRQGKLKNDLIHVEDFASEKEYLDFLDNNEYSCNYYDCAAYSHDIVGQALGMTGHQLEQFKKRGYEIGLSGNAWQSYGNILEKGGISIYNHNKSVNEKKPDLKVGDVVGLGRYRISGTAGSVLYPNARNEALRGVTNSHEGVVTYIDSEGNAWVTHNIHGKVFTDKLTNDENGTLGLLNKLDHKVHSWTLETVARPSYYNYKGADIHYDSKGNPFVPKFDLKKAGYDPDSSINISEITVPIPIPLDELEYTDDELKAIRKQHGLKDDDNGNLLARRIIAANKADNVFVDTTNKEFTIFLNAINSQKKEFMEYFRVTEDEYNELAKTALAIAGKETKFGTSDKYGIKEDFPTLTKIAKSIRDMEWQDDEEMSKGIGQVKPFSITDETAKSKFGVTEESFSYPDSQAFLVMYHLYDDWQKAKYYDNSQLPEKFRDPVKLSAAMYNQPSVVRKLNGRELTYNDEIGKISEYDGIENKYYRDVLRFRDYFKVYNKKNPYVPKETTNNVTDNKSQYPYSYDDRFEKYKERPNVGSMGAGFSYQSINHGYGGTVLNSYAYGGPIKHPQTQTDSLLKSYQPIPTYVIGGNQSQKKYKHGGTIPQTGGPGTPSTPSLPFPNLPSPTYSDSLAIYQNSLDKIKFYDDDSYGFGYKEFPNSIKTNFTDPNVRVDLITKAKDPNFQSTSKFTPFLANTFGSKINKNLYSYAGEQRFKEVSPSGLYQFGDILDNAPNKIYNPLAPSILLHPNITPQGQTRYDVTFDSGRGDASDIPYYDPIAIQPWKDQSEEDRLTRLETYGSSGTPFKNEAEVKAEIKKLKSKLAIGPIPNVGSVATAGPSVTSTQPTKSNPKPKPIHPIAEVPEKLPIRMPISAQHTTPNKFKSEEFYGLNPNYEFRGPMRYLDDFEEWYTVVDKNTGLVVDDPKGKPSVRSKEDRLRLTPQDYYSAEKAPWLYNKRAKAVPIKDRHETHVTFAYGGPTNPPYKEQVGPRTIPSLPEPNYLPLDFTRPYYMDSNNELVSENKVGFNIDGKEWVLPTTINGTQLSDDAAIDYFIKTGEHMGGPYNTIEEGDRAAKLRTSIYNEPIYNQRFGAAQQMYNSPYKESVGPVVQQSFKPDPYYGDLSPYRKAEIYKDPIYQHHAYGGEINNTMGNQKINLFNSYAYGGSYDNTINYGSTAASVALNPAILGATGGLSALAVPVAAGIGYLKDQNDYDTELSHQRDNRRQATRDLNSVNNMNTGLGNPGLNINSSYAAGGGIPLQQPTAVAEGGEVMMDQMNNIQSIEGPKHEQGGVPLGDEAEGKYIFSDRVGPNGSNGPTYAEEAKIIESEIKQYEDKAEKEGRLLDPYTMSNLEQQKRIIDKKLDDLKKSQESNPIILAMREMEAKDKIITDRLSNQQSPQLPQQNPQMLPNSMGQSGQQMFAAGGNVMPNGDPVFPNISALFTYIVNKYGDDTAIKLRDSGRLYKMLQYDNIENIDNSASEVYDFIQRLSARQAPVQQAPVQQAPVQQAPVQQAPVQQAPPVHSIVNIDPMPTLPPSNIEYNGDLPKPSYIKKEAYSPPAFDEKFYKSQVRKGAAFSSLGPLVQLGMGLTGYKKENFDTVTPRHINDTRAQDIISQQYALAAANMGKKVGANTTSAGSYLSNMIAGNVGLAMQAGAQHASIAQQYDNQNIGIDNQAEMQNTQIHNQEKIANLQNKAARDGMVTGALSNLGDIGAGMTADMTKYRNDYDKNIIMLNALNSQGHVYKLLPDGTIIYENPDAK